MAIIRWNSDLFNDWRNLTRNLTGQWGDSGEYGGCWTPNADIYEHGDQYFISLDIPGVSRAGIDVKVEENELVVSGERNVPFDVNENEFYRVERCFGKFTRRFTLGSQVDPEGISAKSENGVLTITVPKREETKPKQIEIS